MHPSCCALVSCAERVECINILYVGCINVGSLVEPHYDPQIMEVNRSNYVSTETH